MSAWVGCGHLPNADTIKCDINIKKLMSISGATWRKHRQFKVAYFYLDKPQGLAVSQAHVLASAYIDGLWFDIHFSRTGQERPDIGTLLELLKTLQLK